jgi:hypothetical protein
MLWKHILAFVSAFCRVAYHLDRMPFRQVSAIQGIGPLTLTYPLKYDHAVGASVKVASAALAPMQAAPYQTFG